ncbi:MAG: hypothetical protein QG661_1881, partial [Actinomycetota bacterium]|nr:hypothetical protein [Actinomycetota bacterium]
PDGMVRVESLRRLIRSRAGDDEARGHERHGA